LKEAEPPWETIQPQAHEYSEQAAALGQYDPPKGAKESWQKLAVEFAANAAELDKAAQAKDKDAALEAHSELANSCMACHREHRRMGPGRGGMGPPPGAGSGGPPGAPPPGSPAP